MLKRLEMWVLMIGYYAAMYGGPMFAIYYNHKEEILATDGGIGGGFMYFLMGIVGITFFKSIRFKIAKMDSTATKIVFGGTLSITLVYTISLFSDWISKNFTTLGVTLEWIMLSQVAAIAIGLVAAKVDKEYLKEVNII